MLGTHGEYLRSLCCCCKGFSAACVTTQIGMDQLPTTYVTFDNVTFDTSTLFGSTDYPSGSHHHLYEYSRTFYIPLLHGLVMIAGVVVNMYMILTLHCASCKDSARRVSDIDVFFSQLGVCNMATLLTLPVWVTQTIFVKGWVFGYLVCKLMTGVMTVRTTTLIYHKNTYSNTCLPFSSSNDNCFPLSFNLTVQFPVRHISHVLHQHRKIHEGGEQRELVHEET